MSKKQSRIQVLVSEEIKEKAEKQIAKHGLTLNEAMRLFLNQCAYGSVAMNLEIGPKAILSRELKAQLAVSEQDLLNGRVVSHEEAMKLLKEKIK